MSDLLTAKLNRQIGQGCGDRGHRFHRVSVLRDPRDFFFHQMKIVKHLIKLLACVGVFDREFEAGFRRAGATRAKCSAAEIEYGGATLRPLPGGPRIFSFGTFISRIANRIAYSRSSSLVTVTYNRPCLAANEAHRWSPLKRRLPCAMPHHFSWGGKDLPSTKMATDMLMQALHVGVSGPPVNKLPTFDR